MQLSTILYEEKQNIGVITLNRPFRMNAVVEQMYDELIYVFSGIEKKKSVKVVIIKGAPFEKNGKVKYSFCAGADLKNHKESKRSTNEKRQYIEKAHKLNKIIFKSAKPVIACLNGHARGAGAEMALCCDFVIMAKEATIAFPETGLGTFVGGGVTYILPRIVGSMRAKYLIYSGKVISGEKACDMGIALKSFEMYEVFEKSFDFAVKLSKKAPVSISYAKKMILKSWYLQYEDASDLEADAILSCMETSDWKEGLDSFNDKREPLYKGE